MGEHFATAQVLEANRLETTVFLNRGDHFELAPLPAETQFSPAFGVNVADFDGDGQEDIFLSQNFFAVPATTSRSDAGRGLLLRGTGRGGFVAVPGQNSGILVYGEQRGSAVGDYACAGRSVTPTALARYCDWALNPVVGDRLGKFTPGAAIGVKTPGSRFWRLPQRHGNSRCAGPDPPAPPSPTSPPTPGKSTSISRGARLLDLCACSPGWFASGSS